MRSDNYNPGLTFSYSGLRTCSRSCEFFGPGWRMYYVMRSGTMIFMLGGGDKSSQEHDIAKAKTLAPEVGK